MENVSIKRLNSFNIHVYTFQSKIAVELSRDKKTFLKRPAFVGRVSKNSRKDYPRNTGCAH